MKALIVIDVQVGLFKKKLYHQNEFIATINTAIDNCRESNGDVIFVQHNNNFLVRDTPDWELFDGLKIEKTDTIIQKDNGNAFKNTDLKAILDKKRIGTIVVCGLVTHGCVRSTCIGAKKVSLDVSLLKNGHTNWAPDAEAKIRIMEQEMGEVGIRIVETVTAA
jgi:nicotinamidase-related amidase